MKLSNGREVNLSKLDKILANTFNDKLILELSISKNFREGVYEYVRNLVEIPAAIEKNMLEKFLSPGFELRNLFLNWQDYKKLVNNFIDSKISEEFQSIHINWISVDEKFPAEGVKVLVYGISVHGHGYIVGESHREMNTWKASSMYWAWKITHWAALPTYPPKTGDEK